MAETRNKGFLLVLMQPAPANEEEFNAWYDTEHIPERLAVPGIETGLRFVCLDGHPRYLAMYDLAAPEVMESPAYVKVAGDNSSPWTKRVLANVKVYRSTGRQIYPGHLITGRTSRVKLLRFRGLGPDAEATMLAGLKANFEKRASTTSIRLLAYDTGKGIDYLGFVEQRAPDNAALDLEAFGKYAAALDLVNTYAPYGH